MTQRSFHAGMLLATLAAFGLTACGVRSTSQPTGSRAIASSPSPVTATNSSGWTVSAVLQAPKAGRAMVNVSVAVKGPVTVYGGCEPPLTAEFLDAQGQPLSTPSLSGIHCMAITAIVIPQGQSQTFSVQIPAPQSAGSYVIRATVNSRPAAQLPDLRYG
jgi:hypothetical protein